MSEITRRLALVEQVRDEWCAEYVKMRARAEKAEAERDEAKAALVTDGDLMRAQLRQVSDKCRQYADQYVGAKAALEAANARIADAMKHDLAQQAALADRDRRIAALREALELLVKTLDSIWRNSNLASVFLVADQHGVKYVGETWEEPLEKARAALQQDKPP